MRRNEWKSDLTLFNKELQISISYIKDFCEERCHLLFSFPMNWNGVWKGSNVYSDTCILTLRFLNKWSIVTLLSLLILIDSSQKKLDSDI